ILIVYFAGALLSHAMFNISDDAGFTCATVDSPTEVPATGVLLNFRASELCHATGLTLSNTKHYLIIINPPQNNLPPGYPIQPSSCGPIDSVKIQSRGIETTPAGFSTFNNDHDEELTFAQTIVQFF